MSSSAVDGASADADSSSSVGFVGVSVFSSSDSNIDFSPVGVAGGDAV